MLPAAILAFSISLDAFAAGFAYGSNKIKIPLPSVIVISTLCSVVTGSGFLIGTTLTDFIPTWVTIALCFIILFILGLVKLLDSITKSIVKKYSNISKEIKLSLLNFKFIISLYSNPEEADIDSSKILSPGEATALAISLSLDGLAVGIGAALAGVNGLALFSFSFGASIIAIILGCLLGNKIARKVPFNLSWLGGIVLIILAFSNLF